MVHRDEAPDRQLNTIATDFILLQLSVLVLFYVFDWSSDELSCKPLQYCSDVYGTNHSTFMYFLLERDCATTT